MKLKNVELIPGTIIDVNDPDKLARVKANVPGLFQSDDPDCLPWIFPLAGSRGLFSTPKVGDKIWVWNNTANYLECWYTFAFDVTDKIKDVNSDYENCEVSMLRESASGATTGIYSTDNTGLTLTAEDSTINIAQNGDIGISSVSNKEINLSSSEIKIGDKNTEYEESVLGQQLKTLLLQLSSDLTETANAIALNPYLFELYTPLMNTAANISNSVDTILAANTKIN